MTSTPEIREYFVDVFGFIRHTTDTTGMLMPVEHHCGHVFDASYVHPIARHADCTVFRCPGCGGLTDDRPRGGLTRLERT